MKYFVIGTKDQGYFLDIETYGSVPFANCSLIYDEDVAKGELKNLQDEMRDWPEDFDTKPEDWVVYKVTITLEDV